MPSGTRFTTSQDAIKKVIPKISDIFVRYVFKEYTSFAIQKYYNLISNRQLKLITSLGKKKYRTQEQLFIAEGPKVVADFLKSHLTLHSLFTVDETQVLNHNHYLVTERELQKISYLQHANTCMALFEIPKAITQKQEGLIVVLDGVRDPGNMGTIIRLCDWFGVTQLVCSIDSADCFNPKVVQATMGSLARVQVTYTNIEIYLKESSLPVYGGVLNGASVYETNMVRDAILVVGNEGKGITQAIMSLLTNKITIPQFGTTKETESLNVATATAILLNEFKRFTR